MYNLRGKAKSKIRSSSGLLFRDSGVLRPRTILALACAILFFPSTSPALMEYELKRIGIYEAIAPSVVNITTEICEPEFFFCSIPSASGSGSGVVLKEEGVIVTNYHVVENATNIQVTLSDGRRLKAEVTGRAERDDLAVLSVDPGDRPLKAIPLGDSTDLKIGEHVLAVGNPFGLGQTLTTGVVSMMGRDIKDGPRFFKGLIQTNAAINPGNSGGALVNSEGKLIGLNTVILSPTGSSVGLGFAIPVNHVREVIPGMTSEWEKLAGWALAFLITYWILMRIYRWGR
jgi:putative serine protease PepD